MNVLIDKNTSKTIYRTMVRIRKFDTTIIQLYADGEIPGFMHLYIGEEAVAAGVCAALGKEDFIQVHTGVMVTALQKAGVSI